MVKLHDYEREQFAYPKARDRRKDHGPCGLCEPVEYAHKLQESFVDPYARKAEKRKNATLQAAPLWKNAPDTQDEVSCVYLTRLSCCSVAL
jgi:hypothetical protein